MKWQFIWIKDYKTRRRFDEIPNNHLPKAYVSKTLNSLSLTRVMFSMPEVIARLFLGKNRFRVIVLQEIIVRDFVKAPKSLDLDTLIHRAEKRIKS